MGQPTTWNFNPLANTADVIVYDGTNSYDSSTQPYDGFATPTSLVSWKNPTAYQSSLIAGATQQYYGGPSTVPLYAGPTTWYANATPDNLSGQYNPQNSVYANLRLYDLANQEYDSGTIDYDGVVTTGGGTQTTTYGSSSVTYGDASQYYGNQIPVIPQSFANWKNPTGWIPITGGNSF